MRHPLEEARDSLTGRPARAVLAEIAEAMKAASRFVIAGHVGPDGDALGSCVALSLGLRRLGKEARALAVGDLPDRYRTLFPEGIIEVAEEWGATVSNWRPDWFVVLDTSEPERLGGLEAIFCADGARRICVDHHPCDEGGRHDHELIVPEAPAAGSLVLGLLDELGVDVTGDIARALWVAVATDTGWFRFSNTGPWALMDAARLAPEIGDVESLHGRIYADLSLSRAHLLGKVLASVRAELEGSFVWSSLSLTERGDARVSELDGVIDFLKTIGGARVVALISEVEPAYHKVSLRALEGAEVAGIARRFGGGGHAKAAGCRVAGTLEQVVARLRSAVAEHLDGR